MRNVVPSLSNKSVILNLFQDPSGLTHSAFRPGAYSASKCAKPSSGRAEKWILKQVQDDEKGWVRMECAA